MGSAAKGVSGVSSALPFFRRHRRTAGCQVGQWCAGDRGGSPAARRL